jgi:hypothetical protein
MDNFNDTYMNDLDDIQLRIDQNTFDILYSDYEYFGYRGINSLVNDVIVIYSKTYINELEIKHKHMFHAFHGYDIDEDIQKIIIRNMMVLEFKSRHKQSKKTKALKIHINAKNENDFLYLLQKSSFYQNEIGFPEIIRDILVSYSIFSRAQRELILFDDIYQKLHEALSKQTQVELYLDDRKIITFSPYHFINPLDDEGNYIMGEHVNSKTDAIPLFRIKKVMQLNTPYLIHDHTKKMHQEIKSTKFSYHQLSLLASSQILEKVQMLKVLSQSLVSKNQKIS